MDALVNVGGVSVNWSEPVHINGMLIYFKLDTGAAVNVLLQKNFEELNLKKGLLKNCHTVLEAYGEGPNSFKVYN